MRTYTVTEYELEDFDAVRENMNLDKAIEILENLDEGWFAYTMPSWGKAHRQDLENYERCCAIRFVIEKLKAGEHHG